MPAALFTGMFSQSRAKRDRFASGRIRFVLTRVRQPEDTAVHVLVIVTGPGRFLLTAAPGFMLKILALIGHTAVRFLHEFLQPLLKSQIVARPVRLDALDRLSG